MPPNQKRISLAKNPSNYGARPTNEPAHLCPKSNSSLFSIKQNREYLRLHHCQNPDPFIQIYLTIPQLVMSTEKMKRLTYTLMLTTREGTARSSSKNSFRSRIQSQRESSKRKYEALTNCSRDEQKDIVSTQITSRCPEWKHDYYRISNTFSVYPKNQLEPFPHNNDKYNVQFLDRSLHGRNLRFPSKEWGYFQPPQDKLYSQHYVPIVKRKRKYNEDYELRTSMFGQTWVDSKRDKIMDEYRLQANPFRTPMSNTFISTMTRDKHNFRKL